MREFLDETGEEPRGDAMQEEEHRERKMGEGESRDEELGEPKTKKVRRGTDEIEEGKFVDLAEQLRCWLILILHS